MLSVWNNSQCNARRRIVSIRNLTSNSEQMRRCWAHRGEQILGGWKAVNALETWVQLGSNLDPNTDNFDRQSATTTLYSLLSSSRGCLMPGRLLIDFNHRKIVGNNKWTVILPANSRRQSLFVLVMVNHAELRLNKTESACSFLHRCERPQSCRSGVLGIDHPRDMNEAIHALREVDKILREFVVTRDNYRVP